MPSYASVAMQEGKLKEEDYRLEYWAWDFVADRGEGVYYMDREDYVK